MSRQLLCGNYLFPMRYGIEEAKFVPAHISRFHYLGESKERSRKEPDSVSVGSGSYRLSHGEVKHFRSGGSLFCAVVIPDEYVRQLDEIEAEIEQLKKKHSEVRHEAMLRSRPLKVSEVKEGKING